MARCLGASRTLETRIGGMDCGYWFFSKRTGQTLNHRVERDAMRAARLDPVVAIRG